MIRTTARAMVRARRVNAARVSLSMTHRCRPRRQPRPPVTDTSTPTDTPTSTATAAPTETSTSGDTPTSTPTHTPTDTSLTVTPTNTPGDETPSVTPITPIVTPTTTFPPPPTTTATMNLDYGDAPDGIGDPAIPSASYPTLLENDGARHIIIQGFQLGDAIDRENDGQPNITATGDDEASDPDDEDGVEFLTPVQAGATAEVRVVASQLGDLDVFVDFNRNGSWADPGEKVINDLELQPGPNDLSFEVPSGAGTGLTFARFRFSSAGGLSYDGLANDGEVEDYRLEIAGAGDTVALLARGIGETDSSIPLDDVTGFPMSGVVRINGERISYSGIATESAALAGGAGVRGSLVVEERGIGETAAQAHPAGSLVVLVPPAPVCIGDCGMDGTVTISELIRGVRIALGSAEVDACPAFDSNGDQAVTINELVSAVRNALNGCP